MLQSVNDGVSFKVKWLLKAHRMVPGTSAPRATGPPACSEK